MPGRTPWDSFKSLWSSWVVEEVVSDDLGKSAAAARPPVKVYFAGDTGYRAVLDGEDENQVPVCPAFEEIGRTFGGFDFAMIPIGYVRTTLGSLIRSLRDFLFIHRIGLTSLETSCRECTVHLRTASEYSRI